MAEEAVLIPQHDDTVLVLSFAGPPGPAGVPQQDFGWSLANALADGESFDSPPLQHAKTLTHVLVHTRSGVEATRTFTVQHWRLGVMLDDFDFDLDPGDTDIEIALTTPFDGERRDVFTLVLPNPVGYQLADLSVSLGSVG